MYHVAFEGRKTEKSVFPSPSKSAGAGRSVDEPHCALTSPELELMYHVPVESLQTAKSVLVGAAAPG